MISVELFIDVLEFKSYHTFSYNQKAMYASKRGSFNLLRCSEKGLEQQDIL